MITEVLELDCCRENKYCVSGEVRALGAGCCTPSGGWRDLQVVAMECHSFRMAVLMNWVKCKTHTKLRSISSKMPFIIRFVLFKRYIS